MNKEVAQYINRQKSPQKEILKKVRLIFFKTIKNCEEKMAWGAVTFADKKFYLAALKDHVNIGFAISGLSENEVKLFQGQGKTMRHIKINRVKDIDEKILIKLIKMVDKKAVCKPNC